MLGSAMPPGRCVGAGVQARPPPRVAKAKQLGTLEARAARTHATDFQNRRPIDKPRSFPPSFKGGGGELSLQRHSCQILCDGLVEGNRHAASKLDVRMSQLYRRADDVKACRYRRPHCDDMCMTHLLLLVRHCAVMYRPATCHGTHM